MMFSTKLAKLGKGKHINCNQVEGNSTAFNIFVSNQNVEAKTLEYTNNSYSLSKPLQTYNYAEVLGINNNFILARNNEYFSIIKVQNGS